MSDLHTIDYVVENRVASITLKRPDAMNAINQKMRQELKQLIDSAESDDDVRVVVVRAEGKCFCSGADLAEDLAGYNNIEEQIQQEYKPVLMAIANSGKPYIASINGACVGIGAALAMSCDMAIMSENAFIYLAFAGLSLVPDGGMAYHLVRAMGYRKAYQAFVEATRIPSDECLKYGFANKVVADDTLDSETHAWAEKLAAGAPLAQKYGKQIMRGVETSSLEDIIDLEAKIQVICATSQDAQAATEAFFAKKKAVFAGK